MEEAFLIQNKLLTLSCSFWQSRCLWVAAKLDVASTLLGGPKNVEEIAGAVKADPAYLYRVLRALETIEIFKETESMVFENTSLSKALTNPEIRPFVISEGGNEHFKLWISILDTVQSGNSKSSQVAFGTQSAWEHMERDPQYTLEFKESMTALSKTMVPKFVGMSDFSNFETVCDLGGSEGVFLSAILKNNQNIKEGINFDMETVISNNKRKQLPFSSDPRFKEVSGDFFVKVPEADCYTMKFILHDWNDSSCTQILNTISQSLKPNGKVYIFDNIVEKGSQSYFQAAWLDVHMMQVVNGKERTKEEWTNLAQSSGFKVDQFIMPGLTILSKK